MLGPTRWLLDGWFHMKLIVQQQRYRPSESIINVVIESNVHDAILEKNYPGKLIVNRLDILLI